MLNKRNTIIKLAASLSIAVFLCAGCGKEKEEEIISSELIDAENIEVGHAKVERGSFTKTVTASADKIFGKTADLSFPFNDVELEEVYVKSGDTVKQGDLIAKIKMPSEEMLNQHSQNLQNEKDTYQAVLDSYETRIQAKSQEASAASGTDREICQAELKALQAERDQYVFTMGISFSEMEAELEKLKNISGQESIYAPFDGIIRNAAEANEGDTINEDYIVASIYSSDEILFSFKNEGNFRYGMEVTIEAGAGDKRQKIKGKVVAADNIMFDDYHTGKAYVAATEEFDAKNLQNIYISGEVVRQDNVLVVDQLSVLQERDQYGVAIAQEKGSKFRHITLGDIGDGKAWILQGVEEGQTLTIE